MPYRTTLLVTLLTLAPAWSQETADPADPTQALLDGLEGCDESLLGSYHYALVFQGAKNMGHMSYTVTRAEDARGGVYSMAGTTGMTIGGRSREGTTSTLLDARFALVEDLDEAVETQGGQSTRQRTQLTRAGDTLSFERQRVKLDENGEPSEDAKTITCSLEHPGPYHTEMASALLLVRVLDRSRPATYSLATVEWPKGSSDAPQGKPEPLTIEVGVPGEVDVRGETITATPITVSRPSDRHPVIYYVDAQGGLPAFGPKDTPILFVAVADADASRQNQGETEIPLGKGTQTPKEATLQFMAVLSRQDPWETLDDVIDWRAVLAQLNRKRPNTQGLSPKGMAELFRAEMEKRPAPMTPEQLAVFAERMVVEVDGDAATVVMPGRGKRLELTRKDGVWYITALPH